MRWFVFLGVVGTALACAGAAPAQGLPPLPARWPHTLQLGVADEPGGAAALRKVAPFGFRYHVGEVLDEVLISAPENISRNVLVR